MNKVLIIDDEPRARKLLKRVLNRNGYEVLTAGNGQEGLEIAAQHRPALVITDIIMPGIDGAHVCVEIRDHLPDIAILAMSGDDARVIDALALGADRMLMKPFDSKELLEIMASMSSLKETADAFC